MEKNAEFLPVSTAYVGLEDILVFLLKERFGFMIFSHKYSPTTPHYCLLPAFNSALCDSSGYSRSRYFSDIWASVVSGGLSDVFETSRVFSSKC